jgi:hypothetical protein
MKMIELIRTHYTGIAEEEVICTVPQEDIDEYLERWKKIPRNLNAVGKYLRYAEVVLGAKWKPILTPLRIARPKLVYHIEDEF